MKSTSHSEDWSTLRATLATRCMGLGAREWVDDAIQASALALVQARQRGQEILDSIAWCVVFVRRRVVDRRRRMRREVEGLDLDALVAKVEDRGCWVKKLRDAGVVLTTEASEMLERIESGYRGSRNLAKCLGRNVKTIRERRRRLQKLLRRLFEDVHGVPPPHERPKDRRVISTRREFREDQR